MLQTFKIPLLLTAVALLTTLFFGGVTAMLVVGTLAILEISLSFDNAVVNAKILGRMNPWWQRMFLTVGILIAVFGMRLVFPLVVVALAAHINLLEVLHLAIQQPEVYAHHLHLAHPSIAAFGGAFLGMLFLDWLLEEREIKWLAPIERQLAKLGKLDNVAVIIMGIALIVAANVLGHTQDVLLAGMMGMVAYLAVSAFDSLFENTSGAAIKGGFAAFMYLELIDASFSFDGVIGAFAITSNIFLIALGLGIGALYVRGLTVYLVRKGTLSEYVYLEHGAHWAIGILAVLLLLTIKFEIPEVVTGGFGVGLIVAAFISSLQHNKRAAALATTKRRASPATKRTQKV
jgi:hypothetical protein